MRSYEDHPDLRQLRSALVQDLHQKGITDHRVLNALNDLPRHYFMPKELQPQAYVDKAFPIGEEQTISQPYTVAYQTQLLNVGPKDKVLEIGTGSAYQAAILAELADEVFTIERQRKLYDRNQQFAYLKMFSNLHQFYGDGYEGLPQHAPFDRILITAAAPYIPEKLVQQLRPGGMMVLPLGKEHPQRMVRLTKLENNELKKEVFDNFSFVPMLEGTRE